MQYVVEILDSLVKQFADPRGSGEREGPNDARVAHGLPDGGGVGVAAGDHVEDALAMSMRRGKIIYESYAGVRASRLHEADREYPAYLQSFNMEENKIIRNVAQ